MLVCLKICICFSKAIIYHVNLLTYKKMQKYIYITKLRYISRRIPDLPSVLDPLKSCLALYHGEENLLNAYSCQALYHSEENLLNAYMTLFIYK